MTVGSARHGALLAAVLWLLLAVNAGPARAATSPAGWRWPLSERPEVVRRFEPPPGPYAAGHRGVDLRSAPGAPVLAAAGGTVTFAGPVAGRPVVVVSHDGGLRTTYEPVAASVPRGRLVRAGEVLGSLVATGSHCLPETCLHWGLRRGETYLDPLTMLGDRPVRLLPLWGDAPPSATGSGPGATQTTAPASRAAEAFAPGSVTTGGRGALVGVGTALLLASATLSRGDAGLGRGRARAP